MLDDEIENILEYGKHGFLEKNCLQKLVKREITLFTHKSGNCGKVVDGKEASCTSIISLGAVNAVCGDKSKAYEMLCIVAAQQQQKAKKRKTPNTTREDS